MISNTTNLTRSISTMPWLETNEKQHMKGFCFPMTPASIPIVLSNVTRPLIATMRKRAHKNQEKRQQKVPIQILPEASILRSGKTQKNESETEKELEVLLNVLSLLTSIHRSRKNQKKERKIKIVPRKFNPFNDNQLWFRSENNQCDMLMNSAASYLYLIPIPCRL